MYQVTKKQSEEGKVALDPIIVRLKNDQIFVNEKPFIWDIEEDKTQHFHIIKDNKSYTAEVLNIDKIKKEITLKINGHKFEFNIKDKLDLLLDRLGFSQLDSNKLSSIKAPMPGLILSINVNEGDELQKGDAVMVLEAMKMENVIKSPGEGIVKSITVTKGESVEKNQILIEF